MAAAFAYFSVFPAPRATTALAPDGDALAALPLVGATIGAVAGSAGALVARVAPRPVAAAVALTVSVAASGALHLDGFLDGCDAYFATTSPQRRLEILKDPHHGSYALAGLLCAGACWYGALVALPPRRYPRALAFAGALARLAAVANARTYPTDRGEVPAVALAVGAVAIAASGTVTAGVAAPAFVVAALALGRALARAIVRRCGRLTGDGYGFIVVVADVAVLVALASRARPEESS